MRIKLVGIYRIYNTINGRSYIGSSANIKSRLSQHLCQLRKNEHHNPKLQKDWDLHGESAFDFQILLVCKRKKLLQKEAKMIKKFKALKKGYNAYPVVGTYKTFKRSKFTKSKMIGNTNGAGNKGNKPSLIARKRMSESAKSRKVSGMTGKKHSPEAKEKMRAAKLGKPSNRLKNKKVIN